MRVFLSFAPEDTDLAQMVADALQTAGHFVLMDMGGITGGDNWRLEVGRAVSNSDWFVVIYSISRKDSVKRKLEFIFALSSEIPILYILTEPTEVVEDEVSRVLDISENPVNGIPRILDFFANPPWLIPRLTGQPEPEQVARDTRTLLGVRLPDRIFIAYSRHQRSLAKDLYEMLVSRGKPVFYDVRIKAGAVWRQTIQKALDDATHVIVIWTPDAAQSDEVEREVSYALAEHKVIIPILSREIPKLPYHLHGLHYVVLPDGNIQMLENEILAAIAQNGEQDDVYD